MTAATQCPQCSTRFKVSQAQLDAHQGWVRCGHCQAAFNATEYLQDGQSNSQPKLAVAADTTPQPSDESTASLIVAMHTEPDIAPENKIESAAPTQEIIYPDSPDAAAPQTARKTNVGLWLAGSVLLLIVLLAQAAYLFRVELAANQPGLKPALVSYCQLLQCSVPLPQKADAMSIESSELEADPAQSGVITLNALLRNHAPYALAYPQLELTLTDAQDQALARRTFSPTEYLKPGEDEKQGLAATRELSVKLRLDTSDLKAFGYRLLLFYPQ